MLPPYSCITNYIANNAVFNVKDYGAVGDGVADDTSAIQLAISQMTSGGRLYFPTGDYLTSADVSIAFEGIEMYGDGMSSKIILGTSCRIFVTKGNFHCHDLWLEGPGYTSIDTNSNGLWVQGDTVGLQHIDNVKIERLRISQFQNRGIFLFFVRNGTVSKCELRDLFYGGAIGSCCEDCVFSENYVHNIVGLPNSYGLGFSQSGSSFTTSKRCAIINNLIDGVTNWEGIDTHSGENISISGNIIKNCMTGIAVVGDTIAGVSKAARNVLVCGNIIEDSVPGTMAGPAIVVAGVTSGVGSVLAHCENVNVADNVVLGYGRDDLATHGCIRVHSTKNISIANNVLNQPVRYGIMLQRDVLGFIVKDNVIVDVWSDVDTEPAGIRIYEGTLWSGVIEGNSFVDGGNNPGTYNKVFGVSANAGWTMYGVIVKQNDCQYATYINGTNRLNQGVDTGGAQTYARMFGGLFGNQVPSNPSYAYQRGDRICNTIAGGNRYTSVVCTASGAPGTWMYAHDLVAVSPDRGDANIVLTMDSEPTQYFGTALTVNRTVTLPTSAVYNGARFRIVRSEVSAFTLTIRTAALVTLKTMPASTQAYADVQYNGTDWILTAYGAL